MAVTGLELITTARIDLQDEIVSPASDGVRWLNADMLGYLNDGQTLIALLKPEASPATTQLALVAGTRQALPAGGLSLVRVNRNVTGAGALGTVPRVVLPETLDGLMPDWHTHTAAAVVKFVGYTPAIPKEFWTYPPQPANTTQKLDSTYSVVPAKLTAVSDAISLTDEYGPALVDYMLHRAFAKDAEVIDSANRSQNALAGFAAKLGVPVPTVRRAVQQQTAQGGAQ